MEYFNLGQSESCNQDVTLGYCLGFDCLFYTLLVLLFNLIYYVTYPSAATSDNDKVRFLKEAAIIAQFNHPNIVALTGVCTLPASEPTLIVLEYMPLGSLHGYLQSPLVKDQLECLTMVKMALDVGSGMQYLAEAGFVVCCSFSSYFSIV